MFHPQRQRGARLRGVVLVCALAIAACGGPSTTLEQTWSAPTVQAGGLRNVVTLYVSRDGAMRRTVEDAMARKLAGEGVRATPAYAVLSPEDLRDREGARAKLIAAGYDGVVALRLVSTDTQLQYVPGTYSGYWGPAWSTAYDPGYLVSEMVVRVETSAYSLDTGGLVWSALSKTVDPDTPREVVNEVTAVVAERLSEQGIVGKSARPATAPAAG